MPILFNARGEPEAPAAVVTRLQELSPRLGLRWVTGVVGAYWALTEGWKPEDPRWARVNTGELKPAQAMDILYTFPPQVREGDIAAWVERRWGPRANAGVKAADVIAQAKRDTTAQRDKLFDQAKDDAEYSGKSMNRRKRMVAAGAEPKAPMVYGATLEP